MAKRNNSKTPSIHDLAIALREKRNVWYHGLNIRLVEVEDGRSICQHCEMDSLCDLDMTILCSECEGLVKKPCMLKLVSKD